MTFKALVFTILGGAFLIAAVIASVSVVRFTAASEIAAGVVTRLNAGGSHPQVAFTTAAGQPASYPEGGLVFGKAVGDRVRVRYKASDPQGTATLDQVGTLWSSPLFFDVLGIGVLFGGGVGGLVGYLR